GSAYILSARQLPLDPRDQMSLPGADDDTPVAALKAEIRRFVEARDWDQYHFPKDLAIGLSIEAAELLEHFRFRSNEEIAAALQDEAFRREVGHELADVLYFVLLLAANLGLDATGILRDKLALSARKYPVDQARGSNRKYTHYTPDSDTGG
ncbi:MAG: nucleotide pyrophosphohydrolase, partial [Gemmatimonadota bacterium]